MVNEEKKEIVRRCGRPCKYPEGKKKHYTLRLTDKAIQYINDRGNGEFIEKLARVGRLGVFTPLEEINIAEG